VQEEKINSKQTLTTNIGVGKKLLSNDFLKEAVKK
jgi:hypothetical protein